MSEYSFIGTLSMILLPVFIILYFASQQELKEEKKKDPDWQRMQSEIEDLHLDRENAIELKKQWKKELKEKDFGLALHVAKDFDKWKKMNGNLTTPSPQKSQSSSSHNNYGFNIDEEELFSDEAMHERRERLKSLIRIGTSRGFLLKSEIIEHLPTMLIDDETIDAVISTLRNMGVKVYENTSKSTNLESLLARDPTEDPISKKYISTTNYPTK